MTRQTINKIQITLSIIIFLYIALFAINKIFADDIYQIGRDPYKIVQRIDDRYLLVVTAENKYFLLDPSLWARKTYALSDFQDEVATCDFDSRYICLTGVTAVHAKELVVIEKRNFKPVVIGDDIILISDVPKFDLYNCDKISECKIANYYRNYDQDPLQDMISEVYFYDKGKFIVTK